MSSTQQTPTRQRRHSFAQFLRDLFKPADKSILGKGGLCDASGPGPGRGEDRLLVACLLSQQGTYEVHLGDVTLDAPKHLVEDLGLSRITPAVLDVRHPETVETYLSAHPVDAIISSLPYFCNPTVAALALKHRCHYFDLTEDVEVTNHIRALSAGAAHAFMPQCGLAPGLSAS